MFLGFNDSLGRGKVQVKTSADSMPSAEAFRAGRTTKVENKNLQLTHSRVATQRFWYVRQSAHFTTFVWCGLTWKSEADVGCGVVGRPSMEPNSWCCCPNVLPHNNTEHIPAATLMRCCPTPDTPWRIQVASPWARWLGGHSARFSNKLLVKTGVVSPRSPTGRLARDTVVPVIEHGLIRKMQHLLSLFVLFMAEVMASNSSTALVEIYRPFLANVPKDPSRFNPYLGGQNFGTCCLLAVSESIFIDNDTLRIRPGQTFFRGDMATLERFPSFPCAATFNGTMEGPPQDFWTPYSWCRRRCPGWSATSPETFGYWLKPLGAFILPSLIFCLSIPRRRRLKMHTAFAPSNLSSDRALFVLLLYAVKMLVSFVVSTIDILIWLSVVFAIAGPILVSSIYEALLDARILRFLQRRLRSNSLSIRSRAHLLLVILLGNLDFDPAWHHSNLLVQSLPRDAFLSPMASNPPTPGSIPWAANSAALSDLVSVKSRLHAMLDSQPSFGGTVGAPVLFYIAAFIWSVYEIEASYGT